jgi:predicted ATPase
MASRTVTHLELKNYKSIERCSVELAPLTLLVGRNGVGKSNILDGLRFLADAVGTTLELAIRERGGIDQVRRRSLGGRPTNPAIGAKLTLPDATAEYGFRIAAVRDGGFRVESERCVVVPITGGQRQEFVVRDGIVERWTLASAPPATAGDRLFLVAASGQPAFRPVFDALRRMTFHNLNPGLMKLPTRPEPGDLLAHDGRNLASVIKRLRASNPDALARVLEYVRAIGVPLAAIDHKQAGALETVEVSQEMPVSAGGMKNLNFEAISLSDGTMRAIGILVSLFSAQVAGGGGPSLVGIEEPETALHPAAAGALMDALIEASGSTQIMVTCHSPELLDYEDVNAGMIRAVVQEEGSTRVGPLGKHAVEALGKHLVTAGEMLRLDQLEPDPAELRAQRSGQGLLWGSPA